MGAGLRVAAPLCLLLGEAAPQAGAAPAGSGYRGRKPLEAAGGCLGSCFDCHSLLESLPRARFAASAAHLDPARASAGELRQFLAAPEVCDGRLFPVSVDGEVWSLAPLEGEAHLRAPASRALARAAALQCAALRELSLAALDEALRAPAACAGASATAAPCVAAAARYAAGALLRRWRAERGEAAGDATAVDVLDFAGNATRLLPRAWAARVEQALQRAAAAGGGAASHDPTASEARATLELPGGTAASRALLELALGLAGQARLQMEHTRTAIGVEELLAELAPSLPDLRLRLPRLHVHAEVYGRHWDVLERLLDGLSAGAAGAPLRFAELGVACGPVGLHLLPRFAGLRYHGADPTIQPGVREAYRPFADRALLFPNTSEEMHGHLEGAPPMDLVFVDGPHTYQNVKKDLELWLPRVRRGGAIAGHDFTCRHPPLLWAVLEHRIATGGGDVHIAMDGMWWWHID